MPSYCSKHASKSHSRSHSKLPDHRKEKDKNVCDIKVKEVGPVCVQVDCKKKLRFDIQFKKQIKLKQIKCVPHPIHEKSLSGSTCDVTTAYCDAHGTFVMDECFNEKIAGKVQTKLYKPKCIDKGRRHKC